MIAKQKKRSKKIGLETKKTFEKFGMNVPTWAKYAVCFRGDNKYFYVFLEKYAEVAKAKLKKGYITAVRIKK